MDKETTAVVKDEMYTPMTFSVDDITGDEDVVEKAEPEIEEEEVEIEGKESKVEKEKEPETVLLKRELAELRDELLKRTAKKEVPVKTEEKEETLSDSQLIKIIDENKDQPHVLLNVMKYVAENQAKTTRDATIKDVNQRQWHSNLSGIANKILADDEDGYLAANPKVVGSLEEYATNLGLDTHPVGKLAAYAIIRLSETSKAKAEKVEKTVPAKTKETTKSMDKTRTFDKLEKNLGLTAEHLAAAKKFGVKPETYAKFVRR